MNLIVLFSPLSASVQPPVAVTSPTESVATSSPSVSQRTAFSPTRSLPDTPHIDLRFLQDRDLYHKLPTDEIPNIFLNSSHRPPPDASLPALLSGGHYRRAADLTVRLITTSQPDAAIRILTLFHTRLACLVLLSRPEFALQEALPLIELLPQPHPAAHAIVSQIPWPLRLLLARLQTIGAADGGRRGIMALYALTAEARAALREERNGDNDPVVLALWTTRLEDLGLRVCDALVEMGELETAVRHLDGLAHATATSTNDASLTQEHDSKLHPPHAELINYRKALLRLRVGNIAGAQSCVDLLPSSSPQYGTLRALLAVAEGDYEAADAAWQALRGASSTTSEQHTELYAQNAAVAKLYMGRIIETKGVLEGLLGIPGREESEIVTSFFPALGFNLATVYELCNERAADKKSELIKVVAEKAARPECGGWERAGWEFKL